MERNIAGEGIVAHVRGIWCCMLYLCMYTVYLLGGRWRPLCRENAAARRPQCESIWRHFMRPLYGTRGKRARAKLNTNAQRLCQFVHIRRRGGGSLFCIKCTSSTPQHNTTSLCVMSVFAICKAYFCVCVLNTRTLWIVRDSYLNGTMDRIKQTERSRITNWHNSWFCLLFFRHPVLRAFRPYLRVRRMRPCQCRWSGCLPAPTSSTDLDAGRRRPERAWVDCAPGSMRPDSLNLRKACETERLYNGFEFARVCANEHISTILSKYAPSKSPSLIVRILFSCISSLRSISRMPSDFWGTDVSSFPPRFKRFNFLQSAHTETISVCYA